MLVISVYLTLFSFLDDECLHLMQNRLAAEQQVEGLPVCLA